MKRRHPFSGLLLIFAILAFTACKKEKKITQDMLIGHSEIIEGARDGRPVESLADLYFDFFRDGTMLSNLPGASGQTTYEFAEGKISQSGGQIEPEYIIQELNDSLLLLTTIINNSDFRFLLARKEREH